MSPEEIREALDWQDVIYEELFDEPLAKYLVLVKAARAYADLLENGATADTQIVQTTNGPLRVLLPGGPSGRYLVVPVGGER